MDYDPVATEHAIRQQVQTPEGLMQAVVSATLTIHQLNQRIEQLERAEQGRTEREDLDSGYL